MSAAARPTPHPVDQSTIELPSGTISYATLGPVDSPHPPIVFVHGVLIDYRLWLPVAELLAKAGYRCFLPTFPMGAHRIPWGVDADRSPRGLANLLTEFIEQLTLGDATLIGNDTGGAICQFALDANPHLVGRVVFTNCDAFEQFPPQPFRLLFAFLKPAWAAKTITSLAVRSRPIRHSPLGVGLLVTDPDPALTASAFEPVSTDAAIRDDFTSLLRAIDRQELAALTPRLSKVTVPVSVVWGSADRAFSVTLGRRLAAVFPQATFTEVPGSRTFVPLDAPQALAQMLTEEQARRG